MRTIPVDLILHELATRLAELPDTQHRDLHLAISRGCIRPQTLAEEWTHGAGVAQKAAWLVRRLDGENMTTPRLREIAAETRAMEVAVARRLADCAISLLVTQDAEDAATAQTLLQAAQYVVGLATAKPSAEAALFTSTPNDRRLNVARDCLPSGVDIIACLRDDKPTTYKASNTDEEYDSPEAAVRAAWEYHQRPMQSVLDRAFKVGDRVWFKPQTKLGEHPTQGEEGCIDRHDDSDPRLPFRVKWDAFSDFTTWHRPEHLALITPTA